jgi:hypothetical protein
MAALLFRHTYDYRIREAICESEDRELFPEVDIPRSTIRSWIHRRTPDVVTADSASDCYSEMATEIERPRRRTTLLGAIVGLLIAMLRVSKVQLDCERLREGESKRILLRAIECTKKTLPLNTALRITRFSATRSHNWRRDEAGCELDDQPSGPRVVPTRLTPAEVADIRSMVENDEHRHMSLRALALHAQRIRKVFASEDREYRVRSSRTDEYGRYVKRPTGPRWADRARRDFQLPGGAAARGRGR